MVKRTLMAAILAQFEEDLLVFTAAGIASILVFREKATGMFSLIPDDNDDDLDQAIKTVLSETCEAGNRHDSPQQGRIPTEN